MDVSIVKYNAGNVQSLMFALNRLGIEPNLTDDPEKLKKADKVIFPGQGEASSAMNYLKDNRLDLVLRELKQPFLGICLGMHLMCKYSEENNTTCLGILDTTVKAFTGSLKIPHMGWDSIFDNQGKLMEGVNEKSYLYFMHSYYVEVCEHTVSKCNYSMEFSTAIKKDNFYAIQAHPEKSAKNGLTILSNFLNQS